MGEAEEAQAVVELSQRDPAFLARAAAPGRGVGIVAGDERRHLAREATGGRADGARERRRLDALQRIGVGDHAGAVDEHGAVGGGDVAVAERLAEAGEVGREGARGLDRATG